MSEPFVVTERKGDIVWLTLNRPERLNAINLEMRDELWVQLELLRDDPSVRAAVFSGAGERAFSAGADITEFGTAPTFVEARDARIRRDLWGVLADLEIPLIASIDGFAYGAGLELSLYCDLRVASHDSTFAIPEVTLGYIPSAGGTQTLPRHISSSEALRMATTGEPISAEEAYTLGFVQRVVQRTQLETTARNWAELLAAREPKALCATKRAVLDGLNRPLEAGLALEQRLAAAITNT